jgi:hypothetical protein
MNTDRLKDAALPHAVSDVVSDLVDLFQKEVRLARAEISAKIESKLTAGGWMAATAVLGLIAILLAVQAVVFGVASFGIAMHWAYLVVAAVFAILGLLTFFKWRAVADEDLMPTRTFTNIKRDISTAKEQLT